MTQGAVKKTKKVNYITITSNIGYIILTFPSVDDCLYLFTSCFAWSEVCLDADTFAIYQGGVTLFAFCTNQTWHNQMLAKVGNNPGYSHPLLPPITHIIVYANWKQKAGNVMKFVRNKCKTSGSLAKKKIMFLHSKNKASRKGYKGEC